MKYDDASYHIEGAKTDAHAGAHTGLYFRWCVDAGLLSEEHTEEEDLQEQLGAVREGSLAATEYLWENTSGKLADVDLTDEGNQFTKWFYKRYTDLLPSLVGRPVYQFTETEVDYSSVKKRLDQEFREWKASPPKKPWWKVW